MVSRKGAERLLRKEGGVFPLAMQVDAMLGALRPRLRGYSEADKTTGLHKTTGLLLCIHICGR